MRVRLRLFVNVILLIEQRSETRRGETRLIYHMRMEVGFLLTCLFVVLLQTMNVDGFQ